MQESLIRVLQLDTPSEIRAELERVGADLSVEEKVARAQFGVVKLVGVSLALARLLYQELTMEGGQVVTAPRLGHVGEGETEVLLCGTRYQFNHLFVRLRWQPSEELQTLADEMERVLDRRFALPAPLGLGGNARFDWARTVVMGILNVTPDSFSGDGLADSNGAPNLERVVARARALVADGADVLDVGGESTRPGATAVAVEVELGRVLPVVRALRAELDVRLSIDTRKPGVAEQALDAGADLVNDVMGGVWREGERERETRNEKHEGMLQVVARHGAPLVLMHNWLQGARPTVAGDPSTAHREGHERGRSAGAPLRVDVMGVIIAELQSQIEMALEAGIAADRLLVDPGIGFGKSPEENVEILQRLRELRVFGLPILIGPSRKGFISKVTGVGADEREEGTAAAVTVGILNGANLIRVHDVGRMVRVARMAEALRHA